MFEKFAKFIGTHHLPNDFYPVTEHEIVEAEVRISTKFPSELRSFFQKIGSGFFLKGENDSSVDPFLINRIIPPDEIADLLSNEPGGLRPQGGFMEGELPFFDLGNRDYLILLPKSDHPNRVLWLSGKPLTESVVEFFNRLYDHGGFYLDAS